MAFQLIYSAWKIEGEDRSVCAASAGITDDEKKSIIEHLRYRAGDNVGLNADRNNSTSANMVYYKLSPERGVLAQISYYKSKTKWQTDNYVIHAYITEDGEKISPFLYVINNCFKLSVSEEEQQKYAIESELPNAKLPKAQYKLSDEEVRKFFIPHRASILSILIQAIIDSAGTDRKIIFNDEYINLKYWFWALECCLPEIIKDGITLNTYAFDRVKDVKFMCIRPSEKNFDYQGEIEEGNYVFELEGNRICTDIEPVKYSRAVVDNLIESVTATIETVNGTENIMRVYNLPISISAGIYQLLNNNIDWFESVQSLKYTLNKIETWGKANISLITENLWNSITSGNCKLTVNEQLLPIIGFIFKYSGKEIRNSIMEYFTENQALFGINSHLSLYEYVDHMKTKVEFLWEYLSDLLIDSGKIDDYIIANSSEGNTLCILAFSMIENANTIDSKYGFGTVSEKCSLIMEQALYVKSIDFLLELYNKALERSFAFAVGIFTSAFMNAKAKNPDITAKLGEVFVFTVMEKIIDNEKSAAMLLSEYAREGYYSEIILIYYNRICTLYPEQTAKIEALLKNDIKYKCFFMDLLRHRLASSGVAEKELLIQYFNEIYKKGFDYNGLFNKKLREYLCDLSSNRQLERAEKLFMNEFNTRINKQDEDVLLTLCDCITHQSTEDIYDHFNANIDNFNLLKGKIAKLGFNATPQFYAVDIGFQIRYAAVSNDNSYYAPVVQRIKKGTLYNGISDDVYLLGDFEQLFLKYILLLIVQMSEKEENYLLLAENLLLPLCAAFGFRAHIKELCENHRNEIPKEKINTLIRVFINCQLQTKDNLFAEIIEDVSVNYLEKLEKNERNILFHCLLQNSGTKSKDGLITYIGKYNKSHLSFWQRIFYKI